ncbi:MAG TPA: alpha/beta hydrolase-fold protein [Polyangiaceae bacterium LLY-WYZ-14_1]|nr:alpha/beta hydrolase-fold protein [Polyangiaceae bacterium LLY-WYZ-14_1]
MTELGGRVTRFELDSAVLRGNPLGDPSVREVGVYLPPGYGDDDDGRRYPVILLLPGFGSRHRSFTNDDPWNPNPVERFDRCIRSGASAPAILAFPDAGTRLGGSQFVDSKATGAYQSFLADEVFPALDARFRTIPEPTGRGVAGRSSGGFGALRLAIDRRDVVGGLAAHAADAAFDVSLRPMLATAATAFAQAGGVAAFAEEVTRRGPRTGPEHEALFVLAALAAYCPAPEAPFPHLDLPFDPETLELVPAQWQRCLDADPLARLAARPDALDGMRLVFIDSGDRDEHGLHFAARRLARLLAARGDRVALRFEEFPGGHRGTGWRYEVSLPALAAALGE